MSGVAAMHAPCIRCGDCADVCAAGLQPQMLLLHLRAGRDERLVAAGLHACSGCGRCDTACPTAIPLHDLFAQAQQRIRADGDDRLRADAARERYLARGRRLQRESDELEQRQAQRQASLSSTDAVAAALARARARRDGAPP
jgi:electron transport complex protein RnfC